MKKEAKQIEYVNKRGQVVHVWPWTLNKRTTLYGISRASYVKGSKSI